MRFWLSQVIVRPTPESVLPLAFLAQEELLNEVRRFARSFCSFNQSPVSTP